MLDFMIYTKLLQLLGKLPLSLCYLWSSLYFPLFLSLFVNPSHNPRLRSCHYSILSISPTFFLIFHK